MLIALLLIGGTAHGVAAQAPAADDARAAAPTLSTACADTDDPVTPETLVANMREAWALVNVRARAALRCYERIVPAAEAFGNARQKAFANDGYAWALSQIERRAEARRFYTRARELYREIDDAPNEGRALRNIGLTFIHTNDHAAAREVLEEATAIFQRLDLPKDEALALEHLMYAMDQESPAKDALRERGLAAARRGQMEEPACGIHHEWGDSLFLQGRYADAASHLTEAVACFERVKETAAVGRALVSLGRVQRAHGQLTSALQYYERALALQQQQDDLLAAVQSLNAIAVTYGYLERRDEALAYYEKALALAKAVPSPENVAFITGQIGNVQLQRGQYAQAAAMLEAAIRDDPSRLHLSFRWSQIGVAYARLGRADEARAAEDRAVSIARPIGVDALIPALAARASVAQAAGRLDAAQDDLTEAMTLLETLRANTIATDFMKRGFGQQHQNLYAAAIDLRVRRGQSAGALEVAEQARARAFLDLLASRAKSSARGTPLPDAGAATAAPHRALDSDATIAAPTLDDVRATARRLASTLLVYWVGDTATHIWVVSPTGAIHAASVDITRARLHDLVASAASSTEAAAAGLASFGSTSKPWRDLYRTVIAPIRAHLPAAPNSLLTIVPHGPLFQVSFAALQNERGQYLLERYRLHYTPALGVLSFTAAARERETQRAAARRASSPAAVSDEALLVGDPLPVTPLAGEEAMPPLPWARREVDEISHLLTRAHPTTLTARAAGEAAVRARIEQAGLLHFATHGVVQQEETLSSYLALADGATTPAASLADDGRLTADEVYGLHLNASLVVLSACRTALGPLSGDGVIGFTRAFLYAGAPSVVATSWDVPDEAGYELMRRFYRARAEAGGGLSRNGAKATGASAVRTASAVASRDTADALRAAQLSVLQALRKGTFTVATTSGRVAPREHPLFWAGFLLVGEP